MPKVEIIRHRKRIHRYFSSMRFCKNLYENHFISFEVYVEIEKRLAKKYGIDEDSLFRISVVKGKEIE